MDNRIIEIVHKNKIGHLGSCFRLANIRTHLQKEK